MRDVAMTQFFSEFILMMQSVVDINEESALQKTGDRVKYFLYLTDQDGRLIINLLNILYMQTPYLKDASLLRFDLYTYNLTGTTDYEYRINISFNGQ
jgi:hypothetical protein